MKNLIFFPYHPDLKTLIDYKDALKEFRLNGFISFKEDKELIELLNQTLGLKDSNYDKLMIGCDAVILLDNYRRHKPDKYYQVIDDAIKYKKEIYVTPLTEIELSLANYHGKYQLLELISDNRIMIEEKFRHGSKNKLYDIDTPIIGVMAQGKHCNKFEIQLLLKRVLDEKYNSVIVSTNALGVLFGCHTIPAFLFETSSFQEKVIKFNYYIHNISQEINPDIVVLGVPEGILPFESREFHL